ncbi:hypothetical protein RHGRI_006921 [Rhododendron griersonianum]|uniref:CCHC-type domain-containing protein n=1 Tax=Rhododendron griersonianum TaxID=479676 RepID=A0AAV6KVP3_9ERIC|nr:hypothetical protein RHGRI_006921 [Rhododendron griersonianum]
MASLPDSISLDVSSEGSNEYPNFVLVGKIISARKPHRQGVFNVINKAWRTRGNFSISVWRDSFYAFTFYLEEDLIKITNQAPWSVMGGLLVLARWNHDMTIEDLDFSHSPFWVQIHGLPLGQMNRKNGEAIASLIGKLDSSGMKAFDTSTFKDYLRLRIIIDITKPLKKGFFLKRREKEDLWVRFKYERLSDFCYVCGLIGHGLNDCTKKFTGNRSELEYGSFLRAEISIIETINPGKPAPTISNSSSEEFIAVVSPLVTAAREPDAINSSDGTISVRKDKAVILCDKPAGKDLPGVGLSSIFDKLLCLKRKSPPSSPSNTPPPPKIHKNDQSVKAISFPVPDIPSIVPEVLGPSFHLGNSSLPNLSGVSCGNRKTTTRRASLGRRKSRLNEVPIISSFQQNQQDLLAFPIEVSPIMQEDGNSPMEGLGRPLTFQNIRGLCYAHRPALVFLMETKNKSAFVDKIRCKTNLLHSFYVDPVGTKAQAWSQLRSCARSISSPWLCIGDFNEVSSSKEKFGGLPVSSSRLEAFNGLISDCSLLDLEFKGLNYTWSNNREGPANIRERIDRALANADWRVMFPYAQNLAPTTENLAVQQAIHKRMEIIMAREEMYLHQRSRINWLNYGDRNSKFFYTTLIQRRQRNQILRLKAHDGAWKESDDDINLEIEHYFSSLFSNIGSRDFSSTIDNVTPKISGEMNRIKEEIDRGNLEPDYFPKVIFLCWFIWKARNELIFHSTNQLPHVVVARALGAWDEFLSATESSTNQLSRSPQPSTSLHWIPPVAGSLKINCDASWSKGLNRGWGGIILSLIDGRRFKISATSAFLAEASVLREACLFAKALNLSSVCIENDNAQLISLSVSELVPPWEVLAIISDIRLLAREEGLSFRWTPREGNEAAHWVASSQASSIGPNWVVYPPEILYSILCKDLR